MGDAEDITTTAPDLEAALAVLRKDWDFIRTRLRTVEHDVVVEGRRQALRLQYPSLRDGQATIAELIRAISTCLVPFSLPRKRIEDAVRAAGSDAFARLRAHELLSQEARSLFIRARQSSNRNGEAGELLLYILTEWLLEAPQIIAKMGLKTASQMPVHGSDGVHVRYDPATGHLILYSGEAKLYADLNAAIDAAVASIATALTPQKLDHEIDLVRRNLEVSGLDADARSALLAYLDPFDESSNARRDVVTCLIGFDFAAYTAIRGEAADAAFEAAAVARLREIGPRIGQAFTNAGLGQCRAELFMMPVPSVSGLRTAFQNHIGWAAS